MSDHRPELGDPGSIDRSAVELELEPPFDRELEDAILLLAQANELSADVLRHRRLYGTIRGGDVPPMATILSDLIERHGYERAARIAFRALLLETR